LAHALFEIGAKAGFALMVPALAGYIAYSVADRPGIAPGMIGGMIATNLGAGFLGGIAAGFIAGYGVDGLNRLIRLPKNLAGLKPVLILPLLGSLLTGLVMIYAVGAPVAAALAFLTDWLRSMQGSSAILLGVILGAMSAFDMGGPVNKAGYAFRSDWCRARSIRRWPPRWPPVWCRLWASRWPHSCSATALPPRKRAARRACWALPLSPRARSPCRA
jgi:PTS system fructose-specific IIC component